MFKISLFLCFLVSLHAFEVVKDINYLEEIEFQGVGKMLISQGDRCRLVLKGSEEDRYDTQVSVHGGVLKIARRKSAFKRPAQDLLCIVTIGDDLNKIMLWDDVTLESDLLRLDSIEVHVHDRVQAKIGYEGDDFLARVHDRAKLAVFGKTDSQIALVEDKGIYEADAFESRESEIKIVGEGSATVQADTLSAFVVGSGHVYYTKEPHKLTERVSGKGSIQRK